MKLSSVIGGLVSLAAVAGAQVFNSTPDWSSADRQVSTGGALADLDRDGWLDLIVANGNDIHQQRVVVYYNNGDGTLPASPDWQSGNVAYHGHLDVADVNGDGWLDVAVSHLGEFSTFAPIARLYLNNNGTLSATPDWQSDVIGNAFGVAFGDVNNDGRPDLAVATGWAYAPQQFYPTYVYLNVNGALEAMASWESDDTYHYQGALWVDGDDDGWLDLVGAASRTYSRLYRNLGGALETTASWRTTDSSSQDAIMAAAGDVNGDGLRDLFLTDNTQLSGGSGRFRQFLGIPGGMFETNYSWSYFDGYGSAVALADVNGDGLLDLATGAWWDNTRLFLNNGSGFNATPTWSSGGTSVVEKIVFGDIDRNSLVTATETFAGVPADQHLFYLQRQPVQEMIEVSRDGVALTPDQYTYHLASGWVSVGPSGGTVEVTYRYSTKLDMAVTNWDDTLPNYVYYNQLIVRGDMNCDGTLDGADIDPFFLAVGDPQQYEQLYPGCDGQTFGDMNDDGALDGADIDPFFDALGG